MKTIIEEAIDAFQANHTDRCLSNTQCNHADLIERVKNYENQIEKNIGQDIAVRLEEVRDDWLNRAELKEGSFAAYIDLIFNVAAKFARELR